MIATRKRTVVDPHLGRIELQLARVNLDDREYAKALTTLSDIEHERLAKIRSPLRRRRFAAGRSMIRCRLADLLGIEPADVPLLRGRHGKPALGGRHAGLVRFNLSGCEHLLLAAFSAKGEVGVDIERIDAGRQWRRLLHKACSAGEAAEAERESRYNGEVAFFRRWVAKEAILKALGCGLAVPPPEIRLRQRPGGRLASSLPQVTVALEPGSLLRSTGFIAALACLDQTREPPTLVADHHD